MLRHHPRISDLHSLIARVPSYPITADELVELAIEEKSDPSVVDFYAAFLPDEAFESEEDLRTRTGQVAMLDEEVEKQPFELMFAPEED